MTADHPMDDVLADVVEEYISLMREGIAPAPESFAACFPTLRDRLMPVLRSLGAAAVPPRAEATVSMSAAPEGTVRMDRRPDVLLLLLHATECVRGWTRLAKLLFLAGRETTVSAVVPDYYQFAADRFGPFTTEVYRDVEALEELGLVSVRRRRDPCEHRSEDPFGAAGARDTNADYGLTAEGAQYADALRRWAMATHPGWVVQLDQVVQRFARLSLNQLLAYVYHSYPQFAEQSEIREQVLGSRPPDIPPPLEESERGPARTEGASHG